MRVEKVRVEGFRLLEDVEILLISTMADLAGFGDRFASASCLDQGVAGPLLDSGEQ
jgi:hypothetical protein